MHTAARLTLRRSLGLGTGLRRAAEGPPSQRLLSGQLLPRLLSSDAPASSETPPQPNKHFPSPGYEVEESLEMVFNRHEEKRMELICLLIKALDTCEPTHKDLVMEKYKEVEHLRREYLAKAQANGQNTRNSDNGATGSKTDGKKRWSIVDLLSASASGVLLGNILSDLESKMEQNKLENY